jgi:hypothetical protein
MEGGGRLLIELQLDLLSRNSNVRIVVDYMSKQ